MMLLQMAVRSGCRIRHRDWPPYHYAEMRQTGDGEVRLCRIIPQSDMPPIEVQIDALNDDSNWKILDLPPE
jgi:hypothetical protein